MSDIDPVRLVEALSLARKLDRQDARRRNRGRMARNLAHGLVRLSPFGLMDYEWTWEKKR